jgi:hypothetical protein
LHEDGLQRWHTSQDQARVQADVGL